MNSSRELPPWALPVVVICSVMVLVMIGWHVFNNGGEVGPSKKVYPGMYDIQKEVRDAQAAKAAGAPQGQ